MVADMTAAPTRLLAARRTPYETFAGVPHNWFGPSSSRSFSAAATTPRSTRSAAPLNSARGFWPGPFAKPPADDKWAGLAAVRGRTAPP